MQEFKPKHAVEELKKSLFVLYTIRSIRQEWTIKYKKKV